MHKQLETALAHMSRRGSFGGASVPRHANAPHRSIPSSVHHNAPFRYHNYRHRYGGLPYGYHTGHPHRFYGGHGRATPLTALVNGLVYAIDAATGRPYGEPYPHGYNQLYRYNYIGAGPQPELKDGDELDMTQYEMAAIPPNIPAEHAYQYAHVPKEELEAANQHVSGDGDGAYDPYASYAYCQLGIENEDLKDEMKRLTAENNSLQQRLHGPLAHKTTQLVADDVPLHKMFAQNNTQLELADTADMLDGNKPYYNTLLSGIEKKAQDEIAAGKHRGIVAARVVHAFDNAKALISSLGNDADTERVCRLHEALVLMRDHIAAGCECPPKK